MLSQKKKERERERDRDRQTDRQTNQQRLYTTVLTPNHEVTNPPKALYINLHLVTPWPPSCTFMSEDHKRNSSCSYLERH